MPRVDRTEIARIPSRPGEMLLVNVFTSVDGDELVSLSKLVTEPQGVRERLGIVFGRADLASLIEALSTAAATDPRPHPNTRRPR